jgi:hypothetical protein
MVVSSTNKETTMKSLILSGLFFTSSAAFAHGSVPEQAAAAINLSAKLLTASQSKLVLRNTASVTAVKTGHEKFDVTFLMSDNTQFNYACGENENVDPVIWECAVK